MRTVFCAGKGAMEKTIPDKNFFRIGEVSRILQVEPYVVRYWESEFKTIKPIRTSADQRLYRRKDVEELLTVKRLLYSEGFTVAGARKRLAEIKQEQAAGTEEDARSRLLKVKKGLQELKDMMR